MPAGAATRPRAQAAASAIGCTAPSPVPKFGHGVRTMVERPDGSRVRVVGCYHVSPHNTFTKRLTPQMHDEVLLVLRER